MQIDLDLSKVLSDAFFNPQASSPFNPPGAVPLPSKRPQRRVGFAHVNPSKREEAWGRKKRMQIIDLLDAVEGYPDDSR